MARRESILKMGNLTLCFGGTQKLEKTGFKDVSWMLKCEVVRVIKLWTKMPKCFKASTTQMTVFSLSLSLSLSPLPSQEMARITQHIGELLEEEASEVHGMQKIPI